MSKLLISNYYRDLEKVIQYSGSKNESIVRNPFQNLLNSYCSAKDFLLIPELPYKQERIKPDGTIKDALRLDWGYWESKDTKDNLDREIEKKFNDGYPDDNILFEDSQIAVLYQKGKETMRVNMKDSDSLDKILNTFLSYVRPEVESFRKAIESFTEDLPTILDTLRDLITKQAQDNKKFVNARNKLLSLCQESINPNITIEDIREMMIQHILTEDIFLNIFNEVQFHRENNVARELQEVINTFLTGNTKRNLLSSVDSYYQVIRREASNIYDHHEKQKFLKEIYESFYKAYNPLAADRLGIVYTPNEIVKFMVESTDYLLHKHFNKLLEDKDVDILDPATGTGTYITEIIEYLGKSKLEYKYKNEIHCNEVAILPYYIANLNIEYSYYQKMGKYEEFNNICFVDTLDHTSFEGKQMNLFAMSTENTERIKRQNDRKISVIIGNPPYNANQQNENDNNKNREYPAIDKRIKATYVKESKAQKTKVYDMYSRFFRWATDRLNDNGIIAFVTNSSFINSKTFDGFRKLISQDFSEAYIIDLDGDVRKNPKLSGTTHNVFGIQTGVAISFLVKTNSNENPCKIFYTSRPDKELAIDKLKFLSSHKIDNINFEHITPDKHNNWINLTDNDFDSLIPIANKEVKRGNSEESIFKLFSTGINTARDEWIIDKSIDNLSQKMIFFSNTYNTSEEFNCIIKWSRNLKKRHQKLLRENFNNNKIKPFCYRPFIPNFIYNSEIFIDERGYIKYLKTNRLAIAISGQSSNKLFQCLISDKFISFDCLEKTQCLPLYTYDKEGKRQENITDWGLQQFREYYTPSSPPAPFSHRRRGSKRIY